MKYFRNISIQRIDTNKLKISWNNKIEVVNIYCRINGLETFLMKVKGDNEVIIDDIYNEERPLFILKADGYVSEVVGEVLVKLDGTYNFRDLGGYKSEDGRRVRWNNFYRADRLTDLSARDIRYLKNMKIKTILDLRSKGEVKVNPDISIDDVEYFNISGAPYLDTLVKDKCMNSFFAERKFQEDQLVKFVKEVYEKVPFNNKAYKKLVSCMEDENKIPIVFHCSEGKDRTGFGAALILLILGVPEKTIIKDYELSNFYREEINKKIVTKVKTKIKNDEKLEVLEYLLQVKKEYIEASINKIRSKYGSIDEYLEKEYALTKKKRKELKNIYLY